MKKLSDVNINNKKVILRCDLNVPVNNDTISDNSKIISSIETIKYLLDMNCKIIILSHFGRVKSEEDKKNNSLKIVAKALADLLEEDVAFVNTCTGSDIKDIVNNNKIVLLENTRFTDIPIKRESANDLELAEFWASLADIYVNDAFGSLHRVHSSTAGISKYLPTCMGLLVEKELNNLDCLINDTPKPFTVFMGGAKVDDKLPIIKELIKRCDYLLVGGGIANSFLKARGKDVGNSLVTTDSSIISDLELMLKEYPDKIVLPIDFVIENECIFDIGKESIELYKKYIDKSEIVFVNGTCGKFEEEKYSYGTKELFNMLEDSKKKVIIGGADTSSAVKQFGFEKSFFYISTGGGATLEYIANKKLTAIEWINENNK